jgi:RIO kinase 1
MNYEEAVDYIESKLSQSVKKDFLNMDRKTEEEVFDRSTVMAIYYLMSRGYVDRFDFPISTGKEANVFRAEDKKGAKVAVKIYRVSTGNFRKMRMYIEGDPRFKGITHDHRKLVYRWAMKEFNNLERMVGSGIRVPIPVAQKDNVLVMEYIGSDEQPAPLMKDADFDVEKGFDFTVESLRKMYHDAKLVHGDMSEYNMLVNGDEFVLIDVSQAVHLKHPASMELLERDVKNIARYFRKKGIETSEDEIMKRVRY